MILLMLVSYGCSEDFIELLPEDRYTSDDFFRNVDEIDLGVIGVYSTLYDIYEPDGGNLPIIVDQMSDDVSSLNEDGDIELFIKDFTNNYDDVWQDHYKLIYRANVLLERADGLEPTEASDQEALPVLLSEIHTLRALAYFNLVRFYGRVPRVDFFISDPEQAYNIGTTDPEEIYAEVIVPDLEFAAQNGAEDQVGEDQGRFTRYTALSLLGKVELTRGNYAEAEAALAQVVNAGVYELVPYEVLYRNGTNPSEPYNAESIIETAYKVPEKGSTWNSVVPWDLRPELGVRSSGLMYVTTGPGGIFEGYMERGETDRFLANIDTTWFSRGNSRKRQDMYVYKYVEPNTNEPQSTGHYVLRYADVLLMYAEALVRNGKPTEAVTYVNQVRSRANMPPLTAEDMSVDTILEERRYELAFEGHRWFDMLRTGRVNETIGEWLIANGFRDDPIPEYQFYQPIPERERNLDPTLPQTEGY